MPSGSATAKQTGLQIPDDTTAAVPDHQSHASNTHRPRHPTTTSQRSTPFLSAPRWTVASGQLRKGEAPENQLPVGLLDLLACGAVFQPEDRIVVDRHVHPLEPLHRK